MCKSPDGYGSSALHSNVKFLVAISVAVLFVSAALATPVQYRRVGNLEARQADCADPNAAVALLRALNPTSDDHFYTTNATEMEAFLANDGYSAQGITAFVFPTQFGTTVPLYRLFNPSMVDHFYTISESSRDAAASQHGYVYEGIQTYVYPPTDQVCGSVVLQEAFNSAVEDHFYTTNATEMEYDLTHHNYIEEGISAFVLPP
ncbi:hypothetical protein EWM64_g8079 [Hericium alpestre]|uniref:DUF5648 domain-containing protein n=1 Tax=Hericium alpestre TaxID=135208 RepID=A0A4Y9ZPI7_9AGAM|nr:hypothetical protein EWM64_g8079 [Hericium alpestre]